MITIKNIERAGGIEPPSSAWKAEVLPLNYARVLQLNINHKNPQHYLLFNFKSTFNNLAIKIARPSKKRRSFN